MFSNGHETDLSVRSFDVRTGGNTRLRRGFGLVRALLGGKSERFWVPGPIQRALNTYNALDSTFTIYAIILKCPE